MYNLGLYSALYVSEWSHFKTISSQSRDLLLLMVGRLLSTVVTRLFLIRNAQNADTDTSKVATCDYWSQ